MPVIDEMLVCKLAQYSRSVCSSCAQTIKSHVACHAAVGLPPQLVPPDHLRQIMLP